MTFIYNFVNNMINMYYGEDSEIPSEKKLFIKFTTEKRKRSSSFDKNDYEEYYSRRDFSV